MEVLVSTENNIFEIGVTGKEDIIQCVQVLLNTIRGTVFLDRSLGVDSDIVDQPLTDMAKLYKTIYEKIEKDEPRVIVKDVKIKKDNLKGKVFIELLIDIDEEYL